MRQRAATSKLFKFIVRIHNNTRLKFKLIAVFSILVLFPTFFIGLTTYSISRGRMIDAQQHSIQQSVSQLNNAIDSFLEIYFNKSQTLMNNFQMQKELRKQNVNIDDVVQTLHTINYIISELINDMKYPYLKNSYYFGGNLQIKIYSKNETLLSDGKNVLTYKDFENEPWVLALQASEKSFSWQSMIDADGNKYISLARRLLDYDTSQDLGVMQLLIPIERIENIIAKNNLTSDSQFLYLDNQNHIIASNNKQFDVLPWREVVSQQLANEVRVVSFGGRKWIGGYYLSDITGWKLIYLMPIDSVTKTANVIKYVTIITIIVSLIACILMAIFFSSYLTRRIGVLVRKTNRIRNGDLSIDAIIPGNDEIGQLDINFNRMIERLKEMIEIEYKSKILINQTKLELLQQQINPHLHYNALAMISSIANKNGQPDILHVSNHLILLYKGILNKGKIISSLRAELNLVTSYIEITNFVYGLEIETTIEVEEEVLEYFSLKLFLQPIVENAVLHGIKPLKRGSLYISCKVAEDRLEIVVSDDGVGIESSLLMRLQSILLNPSQEVGYGLGNVMRRLHLFFGEPYGIRIESAPGIGTTVTVVIPKFTNSEIVSHLGSNYH